MSFKDEYLLTIAIPTYNRYRYIKELIPDLLRQCDEVDPSASIIEVVISDNASSDETCDYFRRLNHGRIAYFRNDSNIGADANFIECVKRGRGTYVWLFGDDELLCDNSIKKVIDILSKHDISLLITESVFNESRHFDSYSDALKYSLKIDKLFPVIHTLITANVFLKRIFDMEYARVNLPTNYGHMYGIMNGLKSGGVYVCGKDNKIISIRDVRADFHDPLIDIEKKLVKYVAFVGTTFNCWPAKFNVWYFYTIKNKIKSSSPYNKFRQYRKKLFSLLKSNM